MTLKIAHRGYCNNYISNTLNSINDAIDNNFDMIEIDIQLDRNNEIIIYHDTYYKNKKINKYSYDELKYELPELLLLSELFKKIDYENVKLYLDLKGGDELVVYLHNLFLKLNINTLNIWMASFNLNHLEILKNFNRSYNLGLITENNFTLPLLSSMLNKFRLQFIAVNWEMLNKNSIDYLHKNNVKVFVYTIKDISTLDFLKPYKIDGIVSDVLL
tara:strand:+ start:4031 stop:4678 length:648 start_codon:yes stop_codon:yes gene_type:complete